MTISIPRKGLIALGVVLLLGLLVALPYRMMMTDDLAGKYRPVPSEELLQNAAAAVLTGKQATLSQDEINGFIAYHLEDIRGYLSETDFIPNQIYLDFKDEDLVASYTPIAWHGKSLGVTAESRILFSSEKKQVEIHVEKVKLGRLAVPTGFALNHVFRKGMPAGVTREENVIFVDLSPYLKSEQAKQAGFELVHAKVQKGGLAFQAKSSIQEYGSQLKQQLEQWLDKNFTGDLTDIVDQLQGYLKKSGLDRKTA